MVVLSYHGTPKRFFKNFEAQIRFFHNQYNIITPSQLRAFYNGSLKATDRPFLLFSFDDGIKNNFYAAELLEKYAIRAFFFVVPEFIDTTLQEQSAYFQEKIRPFINPHVYGKPEDLSAISWLELADLNEAGHEIGSHSLTHTLVAANITSESRRQEIVESKRMIEKAIGLAPDSVRAFCGPNNSLQSVGSYEMALIKQHYDLFFSSFPGTNCSPKNPYFIRRVNLEAFWLQETVQFSLSKLDWMRWKVKVKAFEKVLEESKLIIPGT